MAKDETSGNQVHFNLDPASQRMLVAFSACNLDQPLPRSPVDWDALLTAIQYHGVTGLVYYRLFHEQDLEYPPPSFQEAVKQAHRLNAIQMAEKYEMIKSILTDLSARGIEIVVLKGLAVAQTFYPQTPLRYFVDLDLFAQLDDRDAVDASLRELGYQLEAGYVAPMPKLIPSVITHRHTRYEHPMSQLPVEVHWEDLVQDDLVPRDLDGIWRRAVPITIEGVRVKTLAVEDHLLLLCVHGHHHYFERMFWLSDVLFILRDHADELNWEQFLNSVRLEEAQVPVYSCFKLLNQLFGMTFPERVWAALKPDRFRQWWHERFFTAGVTLPHEQFNETPFSFKSTPWFKSTFLNLMIMGRRREKLHYLLRLLLPTPEWLRQRFDLAPDQSVAPYYVLRLILPPKLMDKMTRKK